MADTQLNSALQVQKWEADFFKEYVRQNEFAPFSGTSANSAIVLKEELLKGAGESINIPLISKLSNDAIVGTAYLEDNEEELDQFNHRVNIDKRRFGVRFSDAQQKFTAISLLNGSREMLMARAMEDTRDRIVEQLHSIDGVAYGSASETQKDAWLVNNADRVLFGAVTSNDSGPGDHSVGLTACGSTTDDMSVTILQLARRLARNANPIIRPFRLESGGRQEMYLTFLGPRAFRDLSADTTLQTAQREVFPRSPDGNPIFNGNATIMYGGMLIVEVPSIAALENVGASGTTDVEPYFMCGAQAIGHAMGRRLRSVAMKKDYGDKIGVGVEQIDGIEKLQFNSKDHGVLTGYVSAVAD